MIYELIKEIEASSAKIGICLKNQNKTFFAYNAQESFDTACSIMVYIMLEYFRLKNEGKISGDEVVEYKEENYATGAGSIKFLKYGTKIKVSILVELMIAISDHIAANMLIDFLGLENINKTIQANGFKNTSLDKKFLIPKEKNMGFSTPEDYCNFYKKLDSKQFYSEESCEAMKEILLKQRYKDILAEEIIKENNEFYIDIACKSGKADGRIYDEKTPSYIADGGIIFTKKGNYYLSVFAELPANENYSLNYLKAKIQNLSKVLYLAFIREK